MPTNDSQAEYIRDLLVQRMELFDPSVDLSAGSPFWVQVVEPVFTALGTDPYDTDIRQFLKDRLEQEFPDLSAQDGDSTVDILITPLEVLLEPIKREQMIARRAKSARNGDTMRLEDARDLAANFAEEWNTGTRATGTVRVFYSSPTYVNVLPSSEAVSKGGQTFLPIAAQVYTPELMLLQRSGTEFYIDVPVAATDAGAEYNIGEGQISEFRGLTGYTRVTNLEAFSAGDDADSASELLGRLPQSLSERTLNVRRGIIARLRAEFPSLRDIEAVGYGDPEMQRDIVTGGGLGHVVSSGVCFIVGQFVLMFSAFEDRGDGTAQIVEGDEIELNFWKFLYEETPNESFTIDRILFDSRNAVTEMPSILLFQIDGTPSVTAPVAGTLPGVLPGVFCVVRQHGKIEISNIPGGILRPDTPRGTIEIEDGEIHIGGHYDVWLRPGSSSQETATVDEVRSESALIEGTDLVTGAEGTGFKHLVHRKYTISVAAPGFVVGDVITGGTSAAVALIASSSLSGSTYTFELWEMSGKEFEVGETISAPSGASTAITAISSTDWADLGVEVGHYLSVLRGSDVGVYRILQLVGPFMYLDIEPTTTAKGLSFRVLHEVTLDLFDPKSVLIPFGDAAGTDLFTTIGSKTLRTTINLQDYGVQVGDLLEILSGNDEGSYRIESWDTVLGGSGPVVATPMSSTNSNVAYRVVRTSQAVQRPLVRLQPDGVAILDPSGQDSGYRVPYSMPVDVRSRGSFSGSKELSRGRNGFVLPDPGSSWAPTGDETTDIAAFDWVTWTGSDFEDVYIDGDFRRCITDECIPCDGWIAVVSIHEGDDTMWVESNLPAEVQTFLGDMKQWFLDMIATFNFGGDTEELINGLSPIKLGAHPGPAVSAQLLFQFEICIPYEMFDGCENVFVALPEFDWESEFESTNTFEDAIARYTNGTMTGRDPALLLGEAGSSLTVLTGSNAGVYMVERVDRYHLVTAGAIESGEVDLDNAYKVGVAVIRDIFPVSPFQGLPEFFDSTYGSLTWSPPSTIPDVADVTITDNTTGSPITGWEWIEESFTWLFQVLNSLGFDLPEAIELDVPETMKIFWQMLFSDYVVARPTCGQDLRLYFVEPTSFTAYAPQACGRYEWALPVATGGALTGETISLPLPDLEDVPVALTVRRLTGDVELSGALTAAAAAALTIETLAAELQSILDPDQDYVTFSGPAAFYGELVVTQVEGGVDELLLLKADEVTDGFRWLGFYESDPGKWVEIQSSGTATSERFGGIEVDGSHALGFSWTLNTTDLVRLRGDLIAGDVGFEIGETITGGTSGATGTLFAVVSDDDGVGKPYFWLTNVQNGPFQSNETITGGTSGDSHDIDNIGGDVDSSPSLSDTNTTDSVMGTFRTMADVATSLSAAFLESFWTALLGPTAIYENRYISPTFTCTVTHAEDGAGNTNFVFTLYDSNYTSVIGEWELDSAASATYQDPDLVDTYVAHVTGAPLTSGASGVITGDDYSHASGGPVIDINLGGTDVADVDMGFTYTSALAFNAVKDQMDLAAYVSAAALLNAEADFTQSAGDRAVIWVGTAAGLWLRSIHGGTLATMATTNLATLGFTDTTTAGTAESLSGVQGTTAAGTSSVDFDEPHPPTLFAVAAGAELIYFTPDIEAEDLQLYPGQLSDGNVDVISLPRDLVVGTEYSGQTSVEFAFNDSTEPSMLSLEVRSGWDWVWVYEQRTFAENALGTTEADLVADRVAAVLTSFGSNVIRLLDMTQVGASNLFTWLESGDQVEVGDIVFVEEGDSLGGYRVIGRSAYELTLDRPINEATARMYRYGNDGVLVEDASDALFTSASAAFTEDDIGRYLTVWLCNREEYTGSYRITAVESDGSGCTLDTDVWPYDEESVHWAVVKAPVTEPGDAGTHGRTALVGLRPVRVYSGEPTKLRVAHVTPHLNREDGRVYCALAGADSPKDGFKQPYEIRRRGAQHISSTHMAEQNEGGLFYFDVLAHSLGGGDTYNVPHETKMTAVFGTYDSDGYRIDTDDPNFTFSTLEESTLVCSPALLPAGFDDKPANKLSIEGRQLRMDYDYAPEVAQAQQLLLSEVDRVLNSNALARHFLPSYVYFDKTYRGGSSPSVVAADLIEHINGLSAIEDLDVSKLEKIFHANSVVSYDHPVHISTVVHDLDRRLVGERTDTLLSDDNMDFHGSARTTFFIAGPDQSDTEQADLPIGERTRLTRGTPPRSLR